MNARVTEPVRPEELIAALRDAAKVCDESGMTAEKWVAAGLLDRLANALEAAGDGPFVIDHTGAVLGTLEHEHAEDLLRRMLDAGPGRVGEPCHYCQASSGNHMKTCAWVAAETFRQRARPSLTEEPTDG